MNNYQHWKNRLKPFTVNCLSGLLGAAIFIGLLHFFAPTINIATVNLQGIVQTFIHSQTKNHVTAIELQHHTKLFGENLEATLHEVAHRYHVILVPEQAVIAGSPDLTLVVIKRLNQRLPNLNRHEIENKNKITTSKT